MYVSIGLLYKLLFFKRVNYRRFNFTWLFINWDGIFKRIKSTKSKTILSISLSIFQLFKRMNFSKLRWYFVQLVQMLNRANFAVESHSFSNGGIFHYRSSALLHLARLSENFTKLVSQWPKFAIKNTITEESKWKVLDYCTRISSSLPSKTNAEQTYELSTFLTHYAVMLDNGERAE